MPGFYPLSKTVRSEIHRSPQVFANNLKWSAKAKYSTSETTMTKYGPNYEILRMTIIPIIARVVRMAVPERAIKSKRGGSTI